MKLEIEITPKAFSKKYSSSENDLTEEITKLLNSGIQAAKDGERAEARQSLLRVTEMEPENEAAWLWLASISEYPEELLVFLHHVLKINPENERALEWTAATKALLAENFIQHGTAALQEDRQEFARQCFLRAADQHPQNENAWLKLYSLAETPEEKTAHLQQVLEINPDNETALSALEAVKQDALEGLLKRANFAAIAGERETALQLLEEIMQIAPDTEAVWMLKAYLAEDSREKLAGYEKVLQLNPDNDAAQAGLASLQALIQKAEEQKPFAEALRAAFEANNIPDTQVSAAEPVFEQEAKAEDSATEEVHFAEPADESVEELPAEEVHFVAPVLEAAENESAEEVHFAEELPTEELPEEHSEKMLSQFEHTQQEESPISVDSVSSYDDLSKTERNLPETVGEVSGEHFTFEAAQTEGITFETADHFHSDTDEKSVAEAELPSDFASLPPIETVMDSEASSNIYFNSETHVYSNAADFVAYEEMNGISEPAELAETAEQLVMVETSEQPVEHKTQENSDAADFLNFPHEEILSVETDTTELHNFYQPIEEADPFNVQLEGSYPQPEEVFLINDDSFPAADYKMELTPEPTETAKDFELEFNTQAMPDEYESNDSVLDTTHFPAETAPAEVLRESNFSEETVSYVESPVNTSLKQQEVKSFACPFCYMKNEPQAIICSSCRTMLSLDDLETMIAYQAANPEVLQAVISNLEAARSSRNLNAEELTRLAIAYFNAKNLRSGLACLQEASQLSPNDLGLISRVNFLTIRLAELEHKLQKSAKTEIRTSTIMIVDDNPTILKLVSNKLEKCGHRVIPAFDGEEALTKIMNVTPDLILLDISMPKMDGYQVCKIIRSQEETRDVPVLMISSKDGIFDESRGKMAGSTGFITKPFGPETLMRTIETYLS